MLILGCSTLSGFLRRAELFVDRHEEGAPWKRDGVLLPVSQAIYFFLAFGKWTPKLFVSAMSPPSLPMKAAAVIERSLSDTAVDGRCSKTGVLSFF